MKRIIPLKTAKKILNDAIFNTYVSIETLGKFSDSLKSISLSYMYGKGNRDIVYKFIYNNGDQDNLVDFLYEVYYSILAHGYTVEYFNNLRTSVTEYLSHSNLSNPIKDMSNTDTEETDVLFGITVFLRMFLKQFDMELIKRSNADQRQNIQQKGK